MASRFLTITIGNDLIKLSEVSYTSTKNVQIFAAVSIPTPEATFEDGQIKDNAVIAKVIREALDENRISSKDVIFCMQSSKIANKEVVTPDLKDQKLTTYINTNATDYFPVNIEDYIIAYSELETIVEEDVKKKRVMVAIAPVPIVEGYYELAEMLDLKVHAVDYTGNAILQFIRFQVGNEPSVVIQMSEESTLVTILNNKVLQLMRTVPYGKSTIANALIEKREITYEEAMKAMLDKKNTLRASFSENDYVTNSLRYLVNNISRVMDYYSQRSENGSIEKAYVMTEGGRIYGIKTLLSNELGIDVEPLEQVNMISHAYGIGGPTDVTLFIPNVGTVISPVHFASRVAAERARKATQGKYFRLIVLAALFVAMLIVLFPLLKYIDKSSTKNDLQNDIKKIEHVKDIAYGYYNAKDRFSDAYAFAAMTYNNDDYLKDFINYLEANMPSDISITSLSVASGDVAISMTGKSKETLAQFIVALKNKPNISNIYTPGFSESANEDGVITVSCSLTCSFDNPEAYAEDETATGPKEQVLDATANANSQASSSSDDSSDAE